MGRCDPENEMGEGGPQILPPPWSEADWSPRHADHRPSRPPVKTTDAPFVPLEPSGLVVRYADRGRGFSRAMDEIDAALARWPADADLREVAPDPAGLLDPELIDAARALGRSDAEDGLLWDPGLETSAECLAYCCARNSRRRELAEMPFEADREWVAGQHEDAEGLTARDECHFDIVLFTVSAPDHLLDSLDGRAEEAAAQDLYGAGLLPV
jgi:hypothetical protein